MIIVIVLQPRYFFCLNLKKSLLTPFWLELESFDKVFLNPWTAYSVRIFCMNQYTDIVLFASSAQPHPPYRLMREIVDYDEQ